MITITVSDLLYSCALMFSLCAVAFVWLSFKLWMASEGL